MDVVSLSLVMCVITYLQINRLCKGVLQKHQSVRDIGCSGIVVRRDLVRDNQFTGEKLILAVSGTTGGAAAVKVPTKGE